MRAKFSINKIAVNRNTIIECQHVEPFIIYKHQRKENYDFNIN